MEVPYAIGHAINKKVNPVMSFTFEEEFKVMDYIVRIEQYQNRRFEFVESQFPRYREMCAGIIQCAAVGKKIPYNYNIDQTLFKIGLDFTKRACVVRANTFYLINCFSSCSFPPDILSKSFNLSMILKENVLSV